MNEVGFFKPDETALLKSTFGTGHLSVKVEEVRRYRTIEGDLQAITYVIAVITVDSESEEYFVTRTEVEQDSLVKQHIPATKAFYQLMADPGGSL